MFVIEKSLANLNHVYIKQQNQIISLKKKDFISQNHFQEIERNKKKQFMK